MDESSETKWLRKLKGALETIELAKLLTTPIDESILNLLQVSSKAIGAEGASVLLPDLEGDGDLRFAWATGEVSEMLRNITIPAGKGIAGFVFSTGQPMAVSDAEQQTSFYAEVDKSTGFSTHTVLATPLQFGGEVIGVLEYVNRVGAPPYDPFTPEEMDLAALYADAVASMVHAFEGADLLSSIGRQLMAADEAEGPEMAREWLDNLEPGENKETLHIALLLKELASRGSAERRLCAGILESLIRFGGREN